MNQHDQLRQTVDRLLGEIVCLQWAIAAQDPWSELEIRVRDMKKIAQQALAEPAQPVAINGQMRQTLEFFIERFEPMRSELRFSQRLAIDKAKAAIAAAKAAEGNS